MISFSNANPSCSLQQHNEDKIVYTDTDKGMQNEWKPKITLQKYLFCSCQIFTGTQFQKILFIAPVWVSKEVELLPAVSNILAIQILLNDFHLLQINSKYFVVRITNLLYAISTGSLLDAVNPLNASS